VYYLFDSRTINKTKNQQELKNTMLSACRVLLTRAREGMIICVPAGNSNVTHTGMRLLQMKHVCQNVITVHLNI